MRRWHHLIPTFCANPLIRHDGLILRRAFAVSFASWWDRIQLLLALAIVGALLHAAGTGNAWRSDAMGALIAAGLGGAAHRLAGEQLSHHREATAFAAFALATRPAAEYAAAIHIVAALVALVATALIGPAALPFAIVAFFIGILASSLRSMLPRIGARARGNGSGGRFRASPIARNGASFSAGIASALIASATHAILSHVTVLAPVAVMSLPGLALCARLDAEALRFLAMTGESAFAVMQRHWASPALFTVAYAAALFPGSGLAATLVALAVGVLAIVFMIVRLLCYRSMDRSAADRVSLALLAGGIVIAAFLPPALPAYLTIVLVRLWKRDGMARWMLI